MKIDVDLVRRLIGAQFPQWAHLPVTPVAKGGWDNRTFRLGEEMIVRMPSAARYASQVEEEQNWLPRLAPSLPLSIPEPLAMGLPGEAYPWRWSIYRWLEGETAEIAPPADQRRLGRDLANFLKALHGVNASSGPLPGARNFHRGGLLAVYEAETLQAIETLGPLVDCSAVRSVWDAAVSTSWDSPPVWVHGDVSAGNLLVNDGRLSGVIDFGCMAVGDPACDLVAAWTFLDEGGADAFGSVLSVDADVWARARGWALWKALIVWAGLPGANPLKGNIAVASSNAF